jgi:CRP/FNR family transcriptional regulator
VNAGLEQLAQGRRQVRAGRALYTDGDAFGALYLVHGGSFKTSACDTGGREQVTGFFMSGDVLGLDGIGSGQYHLTAVAMEDSVVRVAPFAAIERSARELPALQREIHRALSREIEREQRLMLVLGAMRAEERVAAFLVFLSLSYERRGFSPLDFHLRMTREEIGSYLGLTLETVSRLMTRLQDRGLIDVRQRRMQLIDLPGLRALAGV